MSNILDWAAIDANLRSDNAALRGQAALELSDATTMPEMALPRLAAAVADTDPIVREMASHACGSLGRMLSSEQVHWIESELATATGDAANSGWPLAARIALLGHYFLARDPQSRTRRAEHILWIIEHHPDSHVAGTPEGLLIASREAEPYAKARALWQRQCDLHPQNARIQGNAARFFQLSEPEAAERLLRRAQAAEPNNPRWAEQLAQLYSLAAHYGVAERRSVNAQRAFVELEMAEQIRTAHEGGTPNVAGLPREIELSPNERDEFDRMRHLQSLPDRARAALAAGEWEVARQYAEEALSADARLREEQEFVRNGNTVHHCHLVLGQLALRAGDIAQAKSHLLASGKTTGSPQLGSFGPNMSLARQLLEQGEQSVVLEYLELCGKFWEMGADRLAEWQRQVTAGEIPKFGPNLVY